MSWTKDLSMGVRFAFTGGREGWARAVLTAVGVGLGVALLLLTAAIPNIFDARDEREYARMDTDYNQVEGPKGDNTLLVADLDTTFRGRYVRGRAMEPEGPRAPVPPGVAALPRPGEMLVSPALRRLLDSDDGKLLRERLPYRTAGTIGDSGLIGSHELSFIVGAEGLAPRLDGNQVGRIDRFGESSDQPWVEPWDPMLLLLVLVIFIVLLMPVAVFIATAVRFGGERRDRRLAALRLVGADGGMTRRIAAGEALAGATLGLLFGTGFFLIGRQVAGSVEILDISVFPGDLDPSPALALLVAVAVPAAAVAVTLLAMRGVIIEPLGVVRTVRPPRRRLWWRLLLPLGGLAMLYPMIGQGTDDGNFNEYLVTGGVVLLLVGVTALLPWGVERFVARLGTGSLSWQLAVRRLQLSSGSAARMVNGIAVAVAGAIALQMLFSGAADASAQPSRTADESPVQMAVELPYGTDLTDADRQLSESRGVRDTMPFSTTWLVDREKDPEQLTVLTVADCTVLRKLAKLPSCRDGDVFAAQGGAHDTDSPELSRPGRAVYLTSSAGDGREGEPVAWKVPKGIKKSGTRLDPFGSEQGGVLVTPGALPQRATELMKSQVYLELDTSVPDVDDLVRNTTAGVDPLARTFQWFQPVESGRYASIRTGLFIGASCVLAVIGASLLVSQLEQLRERRKLLSSLIAFGTRRRTLSLSVLWQTAIPVGIGLALAVVVGVALGTVLLKMTLVPVTVDWLSVLTMTGIGALVILTVTLLSLPPLLRMMRPDGLRTE